MNGWMDGWFVTQSPTFQTNEKQPDQDKVRFFVFSNFVVVITGLQKSFEKTTELLYSHHLDSLSVNIHVCFISFFSFFFFFIF